METLGPKEVWQAIRVYLTERFPIFSQGITVLSSYVCAYLLFGQAHGHQEFRWATVVGGLTAVSLALVRRITDDFEDLRDDIRSGRSSFADGGRRYARGLVAGAVVTTVLVGILNATCSVGLLAAAVGVAVWFPVATVIKHLVFRFRPLRFAVNETCPAAVLVYYYAIWHEVSGAALPTITVVAIIGLFWTTYQFWNFTRKVGLEGWPPWDLSTRGARISLIVLLALAAGFSVLIAHYAHLHLGYLIYGLVLSLTFAILILRWWARLPAGDPQGQTAPWGGLPFGVAVEVGVLVGVLLASI